MKPKTVVALIALASVNLGIAVGIATLIRFQFLIFSVNMSNPPQCFNYYGDRLACGWRESTALVFALFGACFVLLVLVEYVVWKQRKRRSQPAGA